MSKERLSLIKAPFFVKNKFTHWVVLIISIILLIGFGFILIMDFGFFITRQETTAKIIFIEKPYDYKIHLVYFNDHLEKEITAIVKLKSSYKSKIESFGQSISIYYSRLFSHNVYIKECKVPKRGLLFWKLS